MQGRLDGENAVKDGEGMMHQHFLNYQHNSSVRDHYPKIGDYIHNVVKSTALKHKRERRD
jgi:hypothetical protein